MLLLKHVRNWSYEVLSREVRANLVYREFTRIGGGKVPDDRTMGNLARQLGPQVIEKLHRRVVEIAQENKIATGRKMRVDTTVVETDIHYPTDSSLLGDGVRVLTRIMKKVTAVAGKAGTQMEWQRIRSRPDISVRHPVRFDCIFNFGGMLSGSQIQIENEIVCVGRVVGRTENIARQASYPIVSLTVVLQSRVVHVVAGRAAISLEIGNPAQSSLPRVARRVSRTPERPLLNHEEQALCSGCEPGTCAIRVWQARCSRSADFAAGWQSTASRCEVVKLSSRLSVNGPG